MAMAMRTAAVAAGARILAPSQSAISSRPSTSASCKSTSSSVAHLSSSFSGLSVQTWQKQQSSGSRYGGDVSGLSGISSAPTVSTSPKLVFTVAKIKTHKATAKRFKVTGSGKIMRRHACKQHLLRKKNSKRKRRLSKVIQVKRCDYDNVIGALPYLKVKGRLT